MKSIKITAMFMLFLSAFSVFAGTTEEPRTLRPLEYQEDQCQELQIFAYGVLQGHPILGMPREIQIVNDQQDNIFSYSERYRFYDSIVTVYENEAGEEVRLDDACYIGGKLLLCLQYNGCSYFY